MGQSHITDAGSVERTQSTERVLNDMPAFDPEHRRDLSLPENAPDVRRAARELELVRIRLDNPMRDIDLLELLFCWCRVCDVDVHGPKLRADHPRP